MQINWTEAAGLLAFISGTLSAAVAFGAAGRNRRARRSWGVIAAIHCMLVFEILANMRHVVKGDVDDWLKATGIYPDRRPFQVVLLGVLALFAVIVAHRFIRGAPAPQLRLARSATAVALVLFAVELVSLHAVDSVMYHLIGPVMLIGWLWIACGLAVVSAAMASIRR